MRVSGQSEGWALPLHVHCLCERRHVRAQPGKQASDLTRKQRARERRSKKRRAEQAIYLACESARPQSCIHSGATCAQRPPLLCSRSQRSPFSEPPCPFPSLPHCLLLRPPWLLAGLLARMASACTLAHILAFARTPYARWRSPSIAPPYPSSPSRLFSAAPQNLPHCFPA